MMPYGDPYEEEDYRQEQEQFATAVSLWLAIAGLVGIIIIGITLLAL